jgi:hypothetical protein
MTQPKLTRGWINQPSSHQPHHALHGIRVLMDGNTAYFTEGVRVAANIHAEAVSPGWPSSSRHAPLPTAEWDKYPPPMTDFTRVRIPQQRKYPDIRALIHRDVGGQDWVTAYVIHAMTESTQWRVESMKPNWLELTNRPVPRKNEAAFRTKWESNSAHNILLLILNFRRAFYRLAQAITVGYSDAPDWIAKATKELPMPYSPEELRSEAAPETWAGMLCDLPDGWAAMTFDEFKELWQPKTPIPEPTAPLLAPTTDIEVPVHWFDNNQNAFNGYMLKTTFDTFKETDMVHVRYRTSRLPKKGTDVYGGHYDDPCDENDHNNGHDDDLVDALSYSILQPTEEQTMNDSDNAVIHRTPLVMGKSDYSKQDVIAGLHQVQHQLDNLSKIPGASNSKFVKAREKELQEQQAFLLKELDK